MSGQLVQCACGHTFTVNESDYEKIGRCGGCNRNVRVFLMRGSVFLEPVESRNGEVLPVLGDTSGSAVPAPIAPPKKSNADHVSLFESDGEADEIHAPKIPTATCARCKKEFRGDWDKRPTPNGLYCYICSTLATDPPPGKGDDSPERIIHMPPPPVYDVLAEYRDSDTFFEKHWGKLVFGVLCAALFLAIAIFPVEKILPALFSHYTPDDLNNAPPNIIQFAELIPYITYAIGLFLWIYLGLAASDALPNQLFRHNAVVVAVYVIGFFLVGVGMNILIGNVGRLAFGGNFLMVLILYRTFDLSFWGTIKLVFIGAVIAVMLFPTSMVLLELFLRLAL